MAHRRAMAKPLRLRFNCATMRGGFRGDTEMKFTIMATAMSVTLAGCALPIKSVYVRADGRRGSDDPALAAQFDLDTSRCLGEAQKASLSGVTVSGGGLAGAIAQGQRANAAGDVRIGCMAQKGYVYVPEDQAAARSAEFAKIAAAQNAKPVPTNDRSRIAR